MQDYFAHGFYTVSVMKHLEIWDTILLNLRCYFSL